MPEIFSARTGFNWKSRFVRSSPEPSFVIVARAADADAGKNGVG